jgi:lysophospholipase L1-like esterase
MRKLLPFLAVLALIAAPLAPAQATGAYSVTVKLDHIHITQGQRVTITGQVYGHPPKGSLLAIHAIDGAAPYGNNYLARYASISKTGRFTATYTPVIAGKYFFSGVVTDSGHSALSGAGKLSHSLAVAAAHPKDANHQMVVLGDSISDPGVYNDRRDSVNRAWWSYLSSKTGLQVSVFAQRGSGYLKLGKCTSSTIDGRVTDAPIAARLATAAVIVIEAGVNDYDECVPDGDGGMKLQPSTPAHRWTAINQTMTDLDKIVATNSRVYVTVPWGPRESIASHRDEIVPVVANATKAHGFQYVDMADGVVLNAQNTKDGIHPNAIGTVDMYRALYQKSDLHTRFPKP